MTIELDKLVAEIVGDEAAALSELVAWVTMVRAWNARMDMTAARDDRELVDLMVADASWLAKQLNTTILHQTCPNRSLSSQWFPLRPMVFFKLKSSLLVG